MIFQIAISNIAEYTLTQRMMGTPWASDDATVPVLPVVLFRVRVTCTFFVESFQFKKKNTHFNDLVHIKITSY